MKIKPSIVWMGAAALVAAFFVAGMLRQHDAVTAPRHAAEPNLFPFVRSMEGTKPDGELTVGADDVLVVDAELGRLFDYYLSAVGEKSVDDIRAEIERELDRRLKPAAAGEAKRLLARYLDYKRALVDVEKNLQKTGGSAETARGRMTAMHELRMRFFSAKEDNGLFGFDDAYDTDAVTRLEISQDKSLSDAQKKEKLAALDAALSPALRESREAPLIVVKLEESAQKMRAKGATEDDIYRMRAAALSPEAAARLAAVDREETDWKNRISAYLAERGTLIAGNLAEADRQLALQQLRNAHFSSDEQRRLPAYE